MRAHLSDLAQVVLREREALEELTTWLELEELVLRYADERLVARVTRCVGEGFALLRTRSLARAVAADRVAGDLSLPATSTLAELAVAVPDPWRTMLFEHRDAMRRSTHRVASLVAESRTQLAGRSC